MSSTSSSWPELAATCKNFVLASGITFELTTSNRGLIASGGQYAAFIIFTIVTFFFIDKTGRRPLLIFGAVGMAVCHFGEPL